MSTEQTFQDTCENYQCEIHKAVHDGNDNLAAALTKERDQYIARHGKKE